MRQLKDVIKELRQKHGNKSQVAKKLGISSQLLGQYEQGRQEPKLTFFDKWLEVFNEDIRLIQKEIKVETNVSTETKNGTSVQQAANNKENGMTTRETFYTDLIENNEEYSLLPRAVLKDYKIVPDKIIDVIISSNENEKKALKESMETAKESLIKDYELLIKGLENKVERLEKENEDLRRQIPGKN